MRKLTTRILRNQARKFAVAEGQYDEKSLYGAMDGKIVDAHLEQKFKSHLGQSYIFGEEKSTSGMYIPEINVDIRATNIEHPLSFCLFKSAKQKIYGLGRHILIFIYEKTDNHDNKTGRLKIVDAMYIEKGLTADFQTTKGIREILECDGNMDDLCAFFEDRFLPVGEIEAREIAAGLLRRKPRQGYLTTSSALHWKSQYNRAIGKANSVDGIERLME